MKEAAWQATVIDAAKLQGWLVYHTHDSRRSEKGFPDLVLVRAPRIIFAEVKNETYELTAEQEEWLAALRICEMAAREQAQAVLKKGRPVKPLVEAHLWRPADWSKVDALLR